MSEAYASNGTPEEMSVQPPPAADENLFAGNLITVRRNFSRLGWGIFVMLVCLTLVQAVAMAAAELLWPGWMESDWGLWLLSYLPLYFVALPLYLLVVRKTPAVPLSRESLPLKTLGLITAVCFFMMYAGNMVGIVLTGILQLIPGITATNPVEGMTAGTALLPRFLVMVIGAPLSEEYIFRKQLIDRMHLYGRRTAVVVSAVLFGMFHGNLSQFFYAAALGLVFGYVYLKTGKLRYSIGLHMLINLLGGVIAPMLLEHLPLTADGAFDLEAIGSALPWFAGYLLYMLAFMGLALAGLVILCLKFRQIRFGTAPLELPRHIRARTVWGNWGMILAVLSCFAMFALSLFA